jgi:hypothetical protein
MKHKLAACLALASAVAIGAAGLVLTGVAFGSGSSRTERFTFMSTAAPTGDTFSVIANGAFTDGGTATLLTKSGTLRLREGTISITQQAGQPVLRADTKTCYEHLSEKGAYKIVGGSGRYKGIKGSGTFALSIREVGPLVHDKCDLKTAKRVAGQALLTASGPVTLG